MKNAKVLLLLFVICSGSLIACYAPQQKYPSVMPTAIYAKVPPIVKRGESNLFIIDTDPNAVCYGGIGYYDHENEWTRMDLTTIEASETSECKWELEIPEDAENGIAEFRGYIELEGYERNIFPATFCIEVCK